MRRKRLKIKGNRAVYHVMSRTVNGEHFFTDEDKGVFQRMLPKVAAFCGVKILTYCFMSNHFHLLVETPAMSPENLSDEELIQRYQTLQEDTQDMRESERAKRFAPLTTIQVRNFLGNNNEEAENMRRSLIRRMHDISTFLQTLKQRMSIWYNSDRGRYGPLWADRFKSVLIESTKETLKVMAAYIDLNPVRAGLVEDPADYPFCGYGEACRKGRQRTAHLEEIVGIKDRLSTDQEIVQEYRFLLLGQGLRDKEGKGKFTGAQEELRRMGLSAPPRIHLSALFSRGEIIGSPLFVKRQIQNLGSNHPLKLKQWGNSSWASSKSFRSGQKGTKKKQNN